MRKAIVLAAGKGTRMKSAKHKVLHEIGGLPMIQWILNELKALNVSDTTVVLSPNTDDVQQAVAGQVKTAIVNDIFKYFSHLFLLTCSR